MIRTELSKATAEEPCSPITDIWIERSESSSSSAIYRTRRALSRRVPEPMILREEGSGSMKAAGTFLANAGYSEKDLLVAARTNDPEAIKNLVAQGLGISMISSKAAVNYSRENRLLVFPFPEVSGRRTLYIAKRKHAVLPEGTKEFFQYVKQFYTAKQAGQQ